MATSVSFNGTTYSLPSNREPRGWGTQLAAFLVDVANNSLSKAGGNFTLTADTSFGANYGLVSLYYKSYSANIASSGILRLANTDKIGFRNNANADNLLLGVSTSDRLQFGGANIPTISSTDTLTNKTLTSPVINTPTGIVKGDIGLGNVDNTSDATKDAAATTLTNKTLTSPVINTPTGIVKGDVGLGNVDNTADTAKPVSTAQQDALNLKANIASPTFTGTVTIPTGGLITAPSFASYTDFAIISAQSAPGSGVRVYGKADGKLYKIDSVSGLESAIGGGLAPDPRTSGFTAVSGKHYLINTTSGAVAVQLPAGTSEAAIKFSDANETWDTYNVTITPASGETIDSLATNETLVCDVKRGWVELSWNGARWVLGSLASTTVAEAGASTTGTVTTGTQTFAGAKTFTGALTPSGGIVGQTSGATIASGYVGQKLDFTTRSVTCTLAGSWYANTSALTTLTPGIWMVYGHYSPPNPTATVDSSYAMISTNSSNDGTGNVSISTTGAYSVATTTIANASVVPIVPAYVNVSTDTPIYAKAFQEDRAGLSANILGFAIRIA
jgi:hypothetical protein